MSCPFFEQGRLRRCLAVRGVIVPSLHERERFCLEGDPTRCPTYARRASRGEALPEEVYYSLWLPLGTAADDEDVPDAHSAA